MNHNACWIQIDAKEQTRFLLKCFKLKIPIYETKTTNEFLYLKINEEDYAKVKKFWFVKVKKCGVTGFKKLKEVLYFHRVFLFCGLVGIILLFFLSHIMVSVQVIHSSKNIRDVVKNSLKEKGIRKNSWRKSYQEIEQIKDSILEEYPDLLEWLEIEIKGMNYIVRVEERKKETIEKEKTSCHIVAKKDGLVKEMIFDKGEARVKVNDSVKKGDILISGIITKDNEEKGIVCASGEVFGEVWYTISVSVPMKYQIKERTGKKRWNLRFRNLYYDNLLLKSRIESFEEERKSIVNIFGNELFFVTQYEVKNIEKSYSEEEALEKALNEGISKLQSTFGEKDKILAKKVLKKEVNNSTMNVEIFVAVEENIGQEQEFVKE